MTNLEWGTIFSPETSVEISTGVEYGVQRWRTEIVDATGELLYWAYVGGTIWEVFGLIARWYRQGLALTTN